ncbi:MAG TPA: glycerol kinase GlpK [Terriglobales bacterium]|jgi:glycerol kinase|nr:glycerol kinase GlpK [Terriglobales bacterium]
MTSNYILALDQGTTSSRAIVFGHAGQILSLAQQEFEQIYPSPGQVEHDPEAIWNSQLAVAREALQRANIAARDLAAIGITNQRETTILWERASGRPVANAIVWQSRVSAPICDRLKAEGLENLFRERTGLVVDAYFSGTKIKHLLDSTPGLRPRAQRGEILFGTVDSFLLWRLTGGLRHATDVSNASRTLLFNIHKLDWDDDLLNLLGVPRAMLPEIVSSSEIYGHTEATLLGAPVPIAGMAGDQQAALFGQACFQAGTAKNTYGTGCFALLNTGATPVASQKGLLTSVAWKLGAEVSYCLEGAVFIAGAVVQWLRDRLRIIATSSDIEPLAASVPDSAGIYLVPAFVGLGAPHWDPYARGTLIGITRDTTQAHIARAALESIAYQTCDVLRLMQQEAGLRLPHLKVDGGAACNSLLMQFQADLLGVPVRRPAVLETTALGAAYLAGLAAGYWSTREELAAHWSLEREFASSMSSSTRERLLRRWEQAVSRSRSWAQD